MHATASFPNQETAAYRLQALDRMKNILKQQCLSVFADFELDLGP